MTQTSARRFRRLIGKTLSKTGTSEEGSTESLGVDESVGRDVVDASIAALDKQLVQEAGGRNRMSEDDKSVVDLGRQATDKLLRDGSNAELSPEEEMALEAIAIADGSRPALLIRGDSLSPEDASAGDWAEELREHAAAIRSIAPSIGRIDSGGQHVGTGWVIRPGYVVTNRHVAQEISTAQASKRLALDPRTDPTICFGFEADETTVRPRYAIKEILFSGTDYIEPLANNLGKLDLAVLRLAPDDLAKLPQPLTSQTLAAPNIIAGRDVYAIGYPGPPSKSLLPRKTLLRLLGKNNSVKRLSPGEINVKLGGVSGDKKRTIVHDATTLGGSSGSVIVAFDDIGKPRLVGLHFGGLEVRYGPMGEVERRGRNYAHCFAAMSDVVLAVDAAIAADRNT